MRSHRFGEVQGLVERSLRGLVVGQLDFLTHIAEFCQHAPHELPAQFSPLEFRGDKHVLQVHDALPIAHDAHQSSQPTVLVRHRHGE